MKKIINYILLVYVSFVVILFTIYLLLYLIFGGEFYIKINFETAKLLLK